MFNLQLQIPCSNINKYSIRFPQSKQMSELFEWIYDNFNKFFKVQNKNKLNIYNQGNGQNYRCSNQLLNSCLKNNDFLIISEIESENEQLHFKLEYKQQTIEIIIEDDITIQELMEFAYITFDISNDIKLDLIYKNFNLSNQNITKKLAEFNIQNNSKIKVQPVYNVDNQIISIQIVCKDQNNSFRHQFSKSDILNKIVNKAKEYLGLNDNTVAFNVIYKGKSYNDEESRKNTLQMLKFEEDDIVEIKILYCGGE